MTSNNLRNHRQKQNHYFQSHRKICQDWRKAGRPTSDDHPSKLAKKLSQRNLQKITREEESKEAVNFHEDLMNTHKDNMSGTCQKLKKVRGDNLKSTLILEIETFLGTYTGENVLEGFRANTEYLCNEQPNDKFSSEFLDRCKDDLMIIEDISDDENLKIPPITVKVLYDIIFKKLKCNKACDIYKLTTEHLRHAGDEVLSLLCIFINRVLDDLNYLSAPEFKVALASVIFKGKLKPKNHHKSYRLVRVFPLICHIVDEHIRPMAVKISSQKHQSISMGSLRTLLTHRCPYTFLLGNFHLKPSYTDMCFLSSTTFGLTQTQRYFQLSSTC